MSPQSNMPRTVRQSDQTLIDRLHALHADEFADLGRKASLFVKKTDQSWSLRSLAFVKQYISFIFVTWKRVLWAVMFYPTTVMDRIALVVLSSGLCVIMSLLLPWCLFANFPYMVNLFERVSKKLFNGLGLVNASYPTMFQELTDEQIDAARAYLRQDPKASPSTPHQRVFNLDAAKLLLQCASLMYERTSHTPLHAVSVTTSHTSHPPSHLRDLASPSFGQRIAELCGSDGAHAVTSALHTSSAEENAIVTIAREHLKLCFTTVSEMNSAGAAFCGIFWDPEDTFVIVSFKGTNPVDYMEWNTDFSCNVRDAGQWLSDFGKVHEGFMGKVFPNRISPGTRMPFDTINEAIRLVAADLRKNKQDATINVWVTGHSLGCALASLSYARMICERQELGVGIIVRDAYLFAAPICCDAQSAAAFNNKINHKMHEHPRTMWRITNADDAVATALPDAGDNTEWTLSPYNMFSFAHLGCEIKLRPYPQPCLVRGHHVTPGTDVLVSSVFFPVGSASHHSGQSLNANETTVDGNNDSHDAYAAIASCLVSPRYKAMCLAERIPLAGRLIAHGTGFYWNALQAVGGGYCEWVEGEE